MVEYLMLFIGTPYIYGGNNPLTGFDCSGLICEGLKSEGVIRYDQDLSAQSIYDRLSEYGVYTPHEIKKNYLLFFGRDNKSIHHVAIALDSKRMVEAGGGDSTTLTYEDAAKKNAMVRVRPIDYRKDLLAVIRYPLKWN